MSLRDEIENYLMDTDADLETGSGLMVAADAILVLVRAHLTSDAAVERAMRARARKMWETPQIGSGMRISFGDNVASARAAILAALGEGE